MRHLASLPVSLALVLAAGCTRAPEECITSAPGGVANPALVAGQQVYNRACAVCHQPTGLGVPSVFPPIVDTPILAGNPGRLIRMVLHGLQGPMKIQGASYDNAMPPQAVQLNDEEIAALLSYVRCAWGHNTTPVTAAAVAEIRRTVKRDNMWTWAELTAP